MEESGAPVGRKLARRERITIAGFCVCRCVSSGPLPTVSKGTQVIVPLVENLEDGRWEAAVVKQEGNRIQLSVNSAATAAIGRYQLTVETTCTGGHAVSTHDPANDIYILFNPWCEGKTHFFNHISYFDVLLFLLKALASAGPPALVCS